MRSSPRLPIPGHGQVAFEILGVAWCHTIEVPARFFLPAVDASADTLEKPVVLEEFSNRIGAQKIAGNFERTIQGYTLVDSIKAIFELSSNEFYHLYGWSTERALIFSKVTTGRSPMVALRVTTLKPAAVVLHGITADNIDPVAKRIAEIEQVPLMVTNKPIDQMLEQIKF